MEPQDFFDRLRAEPTRDEEHCKGCGAVLGRDDITLCSTCTRRLNEQFIAIFGLVRGQHYECDGQGHVTAWIGDDVFHASCMWMAWGDANPESPVSRMVQAALAGHRPWKVLDNPHQED